MHLQDLEVAVLARGIVVAVWPIILTGASAAGAHTRRAAVALAEWPAKHYGESLVNHTS